MRYRLLIPALFALACAKAPVPGGKETAEPVPPEPGSAPAPTGTVERGAGLTMGPQEFERGEKSGAEIRDGALELWRYSDDFTEDTLSRYKWNKGMTEGKDEYGVFDFATDAAHVTIQSRPVRPYSSRRMTMTRYPSPSLSATSSKATSPSISCRRACGLRTGR